MSEEYLKNDPAIHKDKLDKCKPLVNATVVKIIDGDTVDVIYTSGDLLGQKRRIRNIGVDAYEYNKNDPSETPEGAKAKAWREKITPVDSINQLLQQDSDKDSTLAEHDNFKDPDGNYRQLCVVYANGKNVNSELIKSGNGFDSVRSTDQISNKEYLTQLADKNRRIDFTEKKESYKAQIARTGKIIEAMKGAEEKLRVPGACKIGTVILPVPPDQITITEQNVNMPINTVRTAGTPKIKTGQQNNRIELTIFFPSLQDINGKMENDYDNSFRKLLAEFLRSPFLPIENQHIRSLIIPDVIWSKPRKLEESKGNFSSTTREREVDKNQGAGYFKRTDEKFQEDVNTAYKTAIDAKNVEIEKVNTDISNIDKQKADQFSMMNNEFEKLEQMISGFAINEDDMQKDIDEKIAKIGKLKQMISKITRQRKIQKFTQLAADIESGKKRVLGSASGAIDRINEVIKYHHAIVKKKWNETASYVKQMEEEIRKKQEIENIISLIPGAIKRERNKIEELERRTYSFIDELYEKRDQLYEDLGEIEKEKAKITREDKAVELISESKYKEPDIYHDVQLACALQSIVVSTVPGFPESLQCNLVLDVFNYSPYSRQFEFCVSNKDALRQIEYYSKIVNLQYPEMAKDMPYASKQGINHTKNISYCEPFKDYVKPLLTGFPVIDDVDITMNYIPSLAKQNKDTTIKSGFNFLAPDNWLRQVGTNDFKRFKCRYDITEFGDEERESLQSDFLKLNADIQFKIVEMVTNIDWGGVGKKVGDVFSRIWGQVSRSAGLFFYGSGSTYGEWGVEKLAAAIKGERTISVPFDIPGTDLKKDSGPYSILFFVKEFKKLDGGKDVINLIDKQIKQQKKLKYGFTNRYKFEFTEDEDTVIAGMSASLETRMAEIPVLNYSMPTKQYMGRGDWVVQVNLQTCNETLMRVLKSLSKKACVSRSLRERIGISKLIARTNSLEVPSDLDYNGFFKVLGITRVLFKDFVCETIKGKPGWWNLTLRLVQSDIDMTEYERLVPSNFFDDKLIEDVKEKLKTKYRLPEDNEKDSYIYSTAMQNMRAMILRLFFFVGFGSEIDPPYGPITSEFIGEQMFDKPNIKDLGKLAYLYDEIVRKLIHGGDIVLPYIYDVSRGYYIFNSNSIPKKLNGGIKMDEVFGVIKDLYLWDPSNKKRIDRFVLKLRFYTGLPLTILGAGVVGAGASIVPGWGTLWGLLAGTGIGLAAGTIWKPTIGLPKSKDPQKFAAGVVNLLLRQQAIKCILYAKKELIEKFGFKKEQFIPKLPLYMKGNYGNYQDLELPGYKSGFLSTPADFFYIREESEDDSSYQMLRDKINTDIDILSKRDELLKYAPGLSMFKKYEKKLTDELLCADWGDDWKAGGDRRKKVMNKFIEITANFNDDDFKNYTKLLGSSNVEVIERYGQYTESQYLMKNVMSISYCLNFAAHNDIIESMKGKTTTPLGLDEGSDNIDRLAKKLNHMMDEIILINQMDNSVLQSWNQLSVWGTKEKLKLLNKCTNYVDKFRARDKTMHMSRAYPTVKLYFIEEDSKEWGMVDDYYAYNAIESVEVISNKNTPGDVATISVSNITGNLSDKKEPQGENIMKEQTLQEQMVLSILLREGTTIMVKAGYDNNPLNLDTIFIGKVVSIQQGDRVSIVAQSFGAELHEKCFDGGNYHVGFQSAGQTHGDIVVYAMKTITGLSNMGSPNMLAKFGLNVAPKSYYVHPKDRLFDFVRSKINPIVDIYYKFGTYDPRLENIYLPFTDHVLGGWLTLLLGWTSKDIGNRFKDNTFDWRISNQSLWEILNEIALYHEDYIVSVLPYNLNVPGLTRQTIYLGPRNGYYKYTDAYDTQDRIEKTVKKGKERREILSRLKYFFKGKKNKSTGIPYKRVAKALDSWIKAIDKRIKELPKEAATKMRMWEDPGGQLYDVVKTLLKREGDLFIKHFPIGFTFLSERHEKSLTQVKSDLIEIKRKLKIIEAVNLPRATKENDVEKSSGVALSIKNPDDLLDDDGNPEKGYMPVRNYYYVDSLRHIVDNSIRASSEEISNYVKIRYPADPTTSKNTGNWHTNEFFADDNIKSSNLRSYISYQNNIDPSSLWIFGGVKFLSNIETVWGGRIPTVYRVGYNVLANMMRPMYRGSLTLLGMPQLRSWDILFIRDLYNGMYGPIEIEQVVHKIDQNGFVTIITPNAVVYPQDPALKYELEFMNVFGNPIFDKLVDVRKKLTDVALAVGGGTAAMGIATSAPATVAVADVLATTIGTGFMGYIAGASAISGAISGTMPWVAGISTAVAVPAFFLGNSILNWTIGKFLGRDCIDIVGLMYKGKPFTAGMEGMYKDSYKVHIMDKIYSMFDFMDTINMPLGEENDQTNNAF